VTELAKWFKATCFSASGELLGRLCDQCQGLRKHSGSASRLGGDILEANCLLVQLEVSTADKPVGDTPSYFREGGDRTLFQMKSRETKEKMRGRKNSVEKR